MRRSSTRRKLLATLGTASTLSIAGCSSVLPTGPSDDSEPKPTGTSAGTANSDGTDSSTGTPGGKGTGTPKPEDSGEVVDDFEGDLKSRWMADSGKYTTNPKQPYKGSQSLVLKGKNNGKKQPENGVNIYRSFYNSGNGGVDLRKHDLSMAVKFKKPVSGRIAMSLLAPAESDMLTTRRFFPTELDGWTRIDLGYTGTKGKPMLKSIQEIRISVVDSEGKPINVEIDDIRKIPKAKKGKVIFQFDDSRISQYEKAFPKLKEYGWKGGIAVIPPSIGTEENMKRSHMREMGRAGWDMMAHPPTGSPPLPGLSPKEQEKTIKETKQWLEQQGFNKGARHIVAPYGRISTKTIEIMKKYHEANYIFGGTPGNAAQPTGMYTIPRLHGTAPVEDLKSILDIAEQFNQLVVIAYHEIGGDSDTAVSVSNFEAVLKYVKKKKMDVVSPSTFLDSVGK